jgi:glutamate transport system permease protein
VLALPKGQSEAAYAIGLRKAGVMRLVLLPQATTLMMPAIVSQFVVLLKDTALGYIIGYQDLLSYGFQILPANYFGTRVSSAIVIAAIYVGLSLMLGALAGWSGRRSGPPSERRHAKRPDVRDAMPRQREWPTRYRNAEIPGRKK